MDLNYNIQTWDFSLRTRTITKITQIVVEAAAMQHPKPTMKREIIAQRATQRAEKLDLLPDMITEIKTLIKPFMKGWLRWYREYGSIISPILTPAGTVDLEKSARALIGCKNQTVHSFLKVASDHCLVDEIFRIAGQLTSMGNEEFAYWSDLNNTGVPPVHPCCTVGVPPLDWQQQCEYYNGLYFKKTIPLMAFVNDKNSRIGFREAMFKSNSLALEYFLKKVSKDEVHSTLLGTWNEFNQSHRWISPALIVQLFKVDQRVALNRMYYTLLLKSLLHWPYQHLFLKAAERLVDSLGLLHYLMVLTAIIEMKTSFYEGHNCKGLYIGLWRLGKNHRKELNSSHIMSYMLVSQVLLLRDKDIAFMVYDDILEGKGEEFFCYVTDDCLALGNSRQYKVLQVLMHVCKGRDLQLYFQLKNIFSGNCNLHDPRKNIFECCVSSICKRHQMWITNLQTFLDKMSEWENSGFPDYQWDHFFKKNSFKNE